MGGATPGPVPAAVRSAVRARAGPWGGAPPGLVPGGATGDVMLGIMQDWPLLLHRIIDHAAVHHRRGEVVSRSVEGPTHRTIYPEIRARARRVAQRLRHDGIRAGDRVGTLAWSTWRHLEAWFGVTGARAVFHAVNPRLPPGQIAWIANHAEDRVLLADLTLVPLLERLAPRLPAVERFVLLTGPEHMPETSLRGAVCYEEWIADCDGDAAWAALDERAASGLCYGPARREGEPPRGVFTSHRSTVLQAMAAAQADVLGLGAGDRVLPVAPMFQADAWGLPAVAPMVGAGLVLPGPRLDAASLHVLMEEERVTFGAAVPGVWMALQRHLEAMGGRVSTCRRVMVGGSAAPQPAPAEAGPERPGFEPLHGWDLAEASPLGAPLLLGPELVGLDAEGRLDLRTRAAGAPFTTEVKITDEEGRALPWDGVGYGRLKVRGPCVARGAFGGAEELLDAEGFLDTGDLATIDPHGVLRIAGRAEEAPAPGGRRPAPPETGAASDGPAAAGPEAPEPTALALFQRWGTRRRRRPLRRRTTRRFRA